MDELKELSVGAVCVFRYGPRPLDLDIIFYGNRTVDTETLQIPHSRFMERPFVLAPVADLLCGRGINSPNHWSQHDCTGGGVAKAWNTLGGEASIGSEDLRRVIPIGSQVLDWAAKTHVMGILNVTTDSFSDGGRYVCSSSSSCCFQFSSQCTGRFLEVIVVEVWTPF